MTDEERLVELKEKQVECRRGIDEIKRLEEVRKDMIEINNLLLAEIQALEKRIYVQNKMADLKGGEYK